MLSRIPPSSKQSIYHVKKNKQPDHLFNLIEKNKSREMSIANDNDENMKERIKQQILQKRVDHIVKNSTAKMKVSECVPFASKKWVSPLTQFK